MKIGNARKILPCCMSGLLLISPFWSSTAQSGKEGVEAAAVVTVMAKHFKESRPVPREAVSISGHGADLESWIPLTGNRASLQLMILLDDSSSARVDSQLGDIKRFVQALPATTQIAIGYMQNGHAQLTQNFTTDHTAAAKTVRSTMGIPGGNGSPYFTLQDVIKRWPSANLTLTTAPRREVLMVTDGVDRYSGARFDPENPYVLNAIKDAQLAGIIVHSIYFRGAGVIDLNQDVVFGGQNYLEEVARATGGFCYTEGLGNPVSFKPFLDELSERLQNQYELSFVTGERTQHGLVQLKLKIQLPKVNVDAPEMARVNVTGTPRGMK